MRRLMIAMLSAFAVIILMGIVFGVGVYGNARLMDGVICEGVYVDNISIGGMTRDEAKNTVDRYILSVSEKSVHVSVQGNMADTTLGELGYAAADESYLEEAMKIGRRGNFFANAEEIRKVRKEHQTFDITFRLDDGKVAAFVDSKCSRYTTKVKNSKITRVNGVFSYSESRPGQMVDVAATSEAIKNGIVAAREQDEISIEAVVIEEQPKVTKEMAELCRDKLGTFSTNYNPGAADRTKNLANAARLMDGSVILPGETYSVYENISPLEESNGYYAAPSYNNGEVVDSIGGGVCQVCTTLYNAVLRAELEIVERYPHSMKVGYVPLSADAAIAGTYKDFKFKNNTDAPLYIASAVGGGTIIFSVYGHETRNPDRTIRFESETIEETEPGEDKITYDPKQPETYMQVTQEAHKGYKAKYWKIIKENGQETKEEVNSSTYTASPRFIVKGTKKIKNTPAPTAAPDRNTNPSRTRQPVTQAPAATQAPAVQEPPAGQPAQPAEPEQ